MRCKTSRSHALRSWYSSTISRSYSTPSGQGDRGAPGVGQTAVRQEGVAIDLSVLIPGAAKSRALSGIDTWVLTWFKEFPIRCHLTNQVVEMIHANINSMSERGVHNLVFFPLVRNAQRLRKVAGSWIAK